MKRKILFATLIVVTLMLGACGKKEAVNNELTPVVESEEPSGEVASEVEETTSVEENEDIPKILDLESIVVEEPATDKLIVGDKNIIDWGGFEITSNENGFNKGVITFFDVQLEIELPQDVGATTSYNETKSLNLSNSSKDKVFSFLNINLTEDNIATLSEYGKEEYFSYVYGETKDYKKYYFHEETKDGMNFVYLELIFNDGKQNVTNLIRDDLGKKMYFVGYTETQPKSLDIARKVINSFSIVKKNDLEPSETTTNLSNVGLDIINWPTNAEIITNETSTSITIVDLETIETGQPILDEIVSKLELKDIAGNIVTTQQMLVEGTLSYTFNDRMLSIQCFKHPSTGKYIMVVVYE